ncbi:MAG TPA: PAS domain S-box protein [Candidatus Binatia bacterium]
MSQPEFETSRGYLAAIVDCAHDAIISKDLNGIVRTFNAAAERLFGYRQSEVIGGPITVLLPPDRRDEESRILATLRRGERIDHFETVRVTKDGRRLDVSLSVSPVRDAAGNVVGAAKIVRDITERKRAAEALAAQREWFRVTLQSIGDAVIASDPVGCVTFMNPVAERLTGWTTAEALGRPLTDVFRIINETSRAPVENPTEKVMQTGTIVGLANHTILVGRDGSEFPIADSAAPIFDDEQRILGVVLVFHDVTEQRRAEHTLAEQREWFETTLGSIGDGVIATDDAGRVVFMNPVAERLTGWRMGDVRGRGCDEVFRIVNEQTRAVVENPIVRVLEDGDVVGLANHTVLIAADGVERPIDDSGAPIRDYNGRIIGAVLVFRDVTQRRRTERAFRDSEARLQGIIASATDAIITVDSTQRILVFNAAAEAIFGYAAPEMLGQPLDRLLPARVRDIHHHDVEEFGHTGVSMRAMGGERVLTALRRNGEEFPIEAHISQIAVEGQTLYTVILRDVTRRKQAEAEREELLAIADRARAEAEGASRAKDEFLAMLGHELRNPLSAIRNALATASLDESRRGRAMEIARRQAEQLGRLIDDLLDVARITQGRIALRKERVHLNEVLQRAVESTRSFVEESRGLQLTVMLAPELIRLDADPARLEQVFVNLLSNAAKYTDAGGHIEVRTVRHGDDVAVHVRDSGMGIAPETLPRIWDLFTQAERTLDRAQGGLGVGLTVARRIVELHGGRIEAHSEGLKKGAEFVVTLPALPATREEVRSPVAPEPLRQKNARVLLVEDNPDAAESLTMLLEVLGHRVRTVYDGLAAIDAARANIPDVMLIDIGLPGMDGYEVARCVRRDPDLKHIVLVALTGYGRDEDKKQAMAAGFDYHLVKPVSPEALHGLVTRLADPSDNETVH